MLPDDFGFFGTVGQLVQKEVIILAQVINCDDHEGFYYLIKAKQSVLAFRRSSGCFLVLVCPNLTENGPVKIHDLINVW